MSKLEVSLTGDNYTQEQKKDMSTCIHINAKCPECGAEYTMLEGPHGGLALNIKCSECKTIFWTTPFPGPGAYPVGRKEDK